LMVHLYITHEMGLDDQCWIKGDSRDIPVEAVTQIGPVSDPFTVSGPWLLSVWMMGDGLFNNGWDGKGRG